MGGQACQGRDAGPSRGKGRLIRLAPGTKAPESGLGRIYFAKGARVFYSYLLSILVPSYLIALGYTGFFVGLALVAILAGNVVSNVVVTYLEGAIGKRRLLVLFSSMMVAAGVILALEDSPSFILLGCFLGNISTTGTEAGPFQSIEAGVLPELTAGSPTEAFGRYNLVGYGAAALGALSSGVPGYFSGGIQVFRDLFAGFALVGIILLLLYSGLRSRVFSEPPARPAIDSLGESARKDLVRLSGLFSIDAFGGSFVSVYVLTSYFELRYGLRSSDLAGIFFVTSILVTVSIYGAARIAQRLGNLRTMVYTHLVSNLFLVAIPLSGSLATALVFLFLRQSLSQMDVPTRQALMAEIFQQDERVTAFALSNTARSVSAFAGSPVDTALLAAGALSPMLLMGGFSKVAYDFAIFAEYRKRFR